MEGPSRGLIKKSVIGWINYGTEERAINLKSSKRISTGNANCFSECTINAESFEYIRAEQKSVQFGFVAEGWEGNP